MPQNENIFQAVNERYNIVEVARDLGIRIKKVASGYRADSIANNGQGENAFAIYPKSNSWYDFMLEIGGDVTDLVAHVKFNGDKGAALRELMPDCTSEKVKAQISAQQEFMKKIERWSNDLFDTSKITSVNALKYLHSRGINDETIRKLKIGIYWGQQNMRILFPYWDESHKKVLYYMTRRFDTFGKGENEKEQRYMKASLEAHPFLKNTAWGLHTLNRSNSELWITEGMFDGLHLDQAGASVLAPNGGEFGKSWPMVIEKIKKFKKVILAFDNDEAGQDFTYKAAQELVKNRIPFKIAVFLGKDIAEYFENGGKFEALKNSTREGRRWFIEYIRPNVPLEDLTIGEQEKAKERCKNFIKQIAPYTDSADIHDILIALRRYFPSDWISEVFKIAKKGLTDDDVRNIIAEKYELLYNEKTGFYEYTDKGIWEAKDDTSIQGYIQDILGRFVTGGKLTSMLKVVKSYSEINSDVPLSTFNTLPLISFGNGTLHIDVKTGKAELLPHRATDYTTVRLPYFFNEKAECPKWEKFISEIMNGAEDKQKVLQEFAGYTLIPECKFHKALMLMGGGSNGKSVFTNIISAVLGGINDGRGYISAAEPSKFAKDFRLMPFKTSWLNISADTENDLRGAEGVFKKIVAGETLEDSYKHKDPHPFKTRTKLMICCNEFPKVNDTSDGFIRRWLIVNFPMHYVEKEDFKQGTNDRILDPYLEDELMKELPGIFNWLLKGLQRLLAQKGFTKTAEQNKLLNDFVRANNPLYTFAEDMEENFYEEGDEYLKGKEIPKREIFQSYKQWAENSAVNPISANRFYSSLSSVLAKMGIEYTEKGHTWQFKDINLGYLDEIEDKGYIKDPEEEMQELDGE